ncbi:MULTISPECIES: hypothetical protein [unclassified Bradyrhizobium]|uniref:hypothetical protein n=1 Tax=unclassified Bradyrhizobium TaxID=2631580 RepID=UPI0028E9A1FB|nr:MULTISPECIES: hypothetical protein [unclassified Bradyrhizobium]
MASSHDAGLLSDRSGFPFHTRGRTLLLVADFGGHHQKQHFDTYTFLILDFAKNQEWLAWQNHFRCTILPNRRRMSFKALNDGMRRRALVPFMRAAAGIEGCLAQFAVSKIGGSLFTRASEDERGKVLLKGWKPNVQERLLRVLHLSAFLLSGLSAPGQDVVWIIDEDDIAANVAMLTDLTELFARTISSYSSHTLGHIRCGTTATADDGHLVLEDLTAIADLTTGALGELCTGFISDDVFPRKGLITPLPANLGWKTRLIASWMAAPALPIRRHTTIVELWPKSTKTRITTLGWRMYEGSLVIRR